MSVALSRAGKEALIAVADQGIGISPEDQRRLFQPFQRTGPARESFPGVGLGLYVARRIVAAHGGRVELESTVGVGSTFRVSLPIGEQRGERP
ncbi:MAG TPA: hypothetical protein DFS52_04195 [Myxococcales bacterium]|nr:hypothetical protein [Myxococcales bacterium]